ncbi:7-beta-(4-carbaxybutanamido)cephalosporanic acid acylase [Phormidium willei BDU 130791]|nr:7-beta-(4-carbaxybutanamido)cephalosporanic acid acylase [Phormidium willei BDU 130791]
MLPIPSSRRSHLLRRGIALILGFAIALIAAWSSQTLAQGPTQTHLSQDSRPDSINLRWDDHGVPHINADDQQGIFYGFGWAQMRSHGDLLLRLYGQARGRAAEYWGEDYHDGDRWVRTLGIPERAADWYEAQSPDFRDNLDAFAAGINAYAEAQGDRLSPDVQVVLPVTPQDVLAHAQQLLHFTFIVNPNEIAKLTQPSHAPEPQALDSSAQLGSNGWAIAPERSASGHTLLLANPHLFWSERFRWYEAHLSGPDINAYGATLVGIPVLTIAFNDDLGWTHTINTYDGWDAYQLDLIDDGYRWQGERETFEESQQTLTIKQSDGTMVQEPLPIRRSRHGPVVHQDADKAIALRVVGLDQAGALEQWWAMAQAQTLGDFEAALEPLQLPMFTIIYGDAAGHILHVFNGRVPLRDQGDFDHWLQIQPGDTPETLWDEVHPYQDLPRVLDPPSGWLQNANDPPWTTTFPQVLSPDDYPAYMAPRGPMSLRSQQSARMLANDPSITFEELIHYKHSTDSLLAHRLLDDLLPRAAQAAQTQEDPNLLEAVAVLSAWDGQTQAGRRGAVLFLRWAETLGLNHLFAQPWQEDNPLTTPDGLADPEEAVARLASVAEEVRATYGRIDVTWGEVFRLVNEETNLPANGADGPLGVFRSLWFRPGENHQHIAYGGDSYVAAIEFSDPVRAMAALSYANASQPNAIPGVEDRSLEQLSRQELRPVWRSPAEINAHLAWNESLPNPF